MSSVKKTQGCPVLMESGKGSSFFECCHIPSTCQLLLLKKNKNEKHPVDYEESLKFLSMNKDSDLNGDNTNYVKMKNNVTNILHLLQ